MDIDKIKGFFIRHGEKFVVGVVVAASAWMVYSGLQLESILTKQRPEQLATSANEVRSSIDEDHSESILTERDPSSFDIVKETLRKQAVVNPSPYQLPNLLERKAIDTSIRRGDPVLAAPKALLVSGQLFSIGVQSSSGNYALRDVPGAEAITPEPTTPPPRSGRSGRGRRNRDAMEEEEMMMEMGTPMMDPAMAGPILGRTFSGDRGVRPIAKEDRTPVPDFGWFIAGTALLPHKATVDSYRGTLADAVGYVPIRDQPMYFNYEIQRADVTNKSVEKLKDEDWIKRGDREQDLKRAAYVWAGYAPELVPMDYRDINLSGYIPPILLEDYSKFVLHPQIPMVSRLEKLSAMQQKELLSNRIKAEDLELSVPGMPAGMEMMDMMDLSMGMDDMGMGMGMGFDMGMAGSTQMEEDPVDNKIMRFYDFVGRRDPNTPRPGRRYVYRIRYSVVDPNFPALAEQQPRVSTLSPDVYTRVQALMVMAEKNKRRDFQRWSEWSEPSEPASLPGLTKAYSGPVSPARSRILDVKGKQIEYSRDAPTAKVVNNNFNLSYGLRMPILMDVTEGSVLSYRGPAELIDPIALVVKKLEEVVADSMMTVIDLEGGRPLKIVEQDTMLEPGLMLLMDDSGEIRVNTEYDDQGAYRIYSFASERGQ